MKTKALFITLISGFLLFPSLSEAQVTLAVQDNAPGYRGSYNNSVSVSLTNNADKVSRVQVDICDVDDFLTIFDCATTARSRDGFSCQAFDLPSGCARVILSSPGGIITEGTGAILTLKYNASASAPAGQCRALNEQNTFVFDENSATLTVTPDAGSFCFNSCTQGSQCNDGLYCNGTDACSSGACTHTGNPCPGTQCNTCQEATDTCFDPAGTACTNDGLFCNGAEICNGSGSCTHAGSPCPNATCVEAQDLCTCALPGESCEDNNFCNGGDFCLFGLCEHVGDPCTPQGLHCAEEVGRCICFIDAECDDLNFCTDDRCETDGSCRQFVNTKPCDDGLFCNGADTCSCGTCGHSGDPCVSPNVCNENTNACANRQVEVTVGFGAGAIGTTDRQVNVQLKNASNFVSGMQMEVCDENDYLIATSCAVSPTFDANFDCAVNELPGGCASAVLTPTGSSPINLSGTMRTIFNIGFDVGLCVKRGTACTGCGTPCYQPGVSCSAGAADCYRYDRNKDCNCNENGCYSLEDVCPPADTGDVWLTPENLLVLDPSDNVLRALPVPAPFANFEITCDQSADCSKGSVCSIDTCSGGSCIHSASGVSTCNDGLFCTATDRCVTTECVGQGDTCASVFLCDEETNQCFTCTGDSDCDGVPDGSDNCVQTPNGPDGGICVAGAQGSPCLEHCDCGTPPNATCNTVQEDTYPPGGNNLGDACECEGNFDCDPDVDGSDANKFKLDFGRSSFSNPCTNIARCNGDFDCDKDVDGTDALLFKRDFGRSAFSKPCPPCAGGIWCTYP